MTRDPKTALDNANHDLELVIDQASFQYGRGRLVLNSRIIAVEEGSLVFQIITRKLTPDSPRSGYELHSLQLFKLEGTWQANPYNQLTFLVRRQAHPDILTFQAAWQLNNNQQISYAYERTDLKTKARVRNILTFKGYWGKREGWNLAFRYPFRMLKSCLHFLRHLR